MNNEVFDYIVVGGGAAGCVVAGRLSEDPTKRVLLLEEGPHDRSIFIRAPGGFFKLHGTKRTFTYAGEPEPACGGRTYPFLQGRVLGGGLSINAMVYMRGQKEDFEDWRNMGCSGWGYEDVLPYFRMSESNARYSLPFHGVDGPLTISDADHRHELSNAFVRAAQEAGYRDGRPIPFNPDFNGGMQEGAGFYQSFTYRGERVSTARAYLDRKQKNLAVQTDAMVTRIIVENRRAVGVAVRTRSGEHRVSARNEVILCAGAFMSPKILMLSGIGPAAHLAELGIKVEADLPGVGANYQDHLITPVDAILKEPVSLMGQDRGWNAARNGFQWLMFRTGALASTVVECGGYFDIDGDGRPEINLNALAVSSAGWGDPLPQDVHCFSLAPLCLTCHSKGEVRLRTRDAEQPPRVLGNFFAHEQEMRNQVEGVRLARHIMRAPSLAKYLKSEQLPGAAVSDETKDIEEYIRARSSTGLHAAGTCAMGVTNDAVVDLQLNVRGIEGLRVADASVMPKVVRGNTAAATIMIAERAADFIRRSGSGKIEKLQSVASVATAI
ncbi:GMC family oxidoreductase [Paraburkholderia sabiae]|uniref:GMC family oxidoreductase N-terminal domain-containing protein n=1 Tax=Paraburkholderia sabiae TaxID=273251 RepID=A0ABU9QKG3_9BURK|nr:GMC family oxidoreductase N-terminal domain-containing protein [Paraburkholderia sabiae]WJZ76485.1 GMC family oxidoreductase N-terminal domain-containing protein [Paraburkholderia sabiae]CAD6560204.1 Alcohol dehydrogenase [acceptor] [Paraburkholderia sabiae]